MFARTDLNLTLSLFLFFWQNLLEGAVWKRVTLTRKIGVLLPSNSEAEDEEEENLL